ncbi:MAG: type IV pilus modification protein PilV [Gammaproteobacteria bacterium]
MMKTTHTKLINVQTRKATRGFSLIEVLIALVILSVGMLGVLTLQVKGLQFSQSARISTNAIMAASDMADRIRSNPTGGVNYVVGLGGGADRPPAQCADLPDEPMAPNTTCTAAELAAFDIWLWKDALSRDTGIPEGDGAIAVLTPAIGTPGTTSYNITLNYIERGEPRTYQILVNN